jgi:hypothetical protein
MTRRSFNGSFVGYVPEAELPLDDLRAMLDWKKVLRNDSVNDAEIEAYWDQVIAHLET